MGWAGAVSIGTHCGLDGPGIKLQWGKFSTPIQPPVQWELGLFPKVKVARVWC